MSADDALLSYRQLHQELSRLCQEQRTGTVMIATPENNLVRVLIEAGQIVSLSFGQKQGEEAIPLARAIKTGRLRFSEGKAVGGRDTQTLPPTGILLGLLAPGGAVPGGAKPVAASPPPSGSGSAILRAVEEELIGFLGPMGTLVLQDHAAKAGDVTREDALRRLLDALAAEIRDPDKIRQFKERVAARLRTR